MLDKFNRFNTDNQLFLSNDALLVGVSGGMDSICLITLLQRLNINFSIAHCNFQLRGTDSDEDEAFVHAWATTNNRPFYNIKFDTKKVVSKRKSSVQIEARNLRYEWFQELLQEHNFRYIATAHHITDSIETVFLNMANGCGIRGLHGILPKNQSIIRPLLCFTRYEIQNFILDNAIPYREDKSNTSIKYRRNFIRHEVLPKFREINPSFDEAGGKFVKKMQDVEHLMQMAIQNLRSDILTENDTEITIDLSVISNYPSQKTILFELIRSYGFNSTQVDDILEKRQINSGKIFISKKNIKGILHEKHFIIQQPPIKGIESLDIHGEGIYTFNSYQLKISSIQKPQSLRTGFNTIIIDQNTIEFPITIRLWRDGDHFQPFGMHGQRKKIKDFFVDRKINILEKAKIPILESKDKILWIVGRRMADWCKVTPGTSKFLKIELIT